MQLTKFLGVYCLLKSYQDSCTVYNSRLGITYFGFSHLSLSYTMVSIGTKLVLLILNSDRTELLLRSPLISRRTIQTELNTSQLTCCFSTGKYSKSFFRVLF